MHENPKAVFADSCDTHMHVYGPAQAYPTAATNARSLPEGCHFADYRREIMERLGIERAVVVQPTAYGTDHRCTLDALAAFGPQARGVAMLDDGVGEDSLERLTAAGIRGLRVHMLPGGVLSWDKVETMAARVREFGWHVQLQLDGRTLPEHEALLNRLPVTLVIDHIGKFMEPVSVDHPAFRTLLRLVDRGAWIKLSAPYQASREGPPLYEDVGTLAKTLLRMAPDRMLWASNWPHPSVDVKPDDATLLNAFFGWIADEQARHAVLVDNPARLYGFDEADRDRAIGRGAV